MRSRAIDNHTRAAITGNKIRVRPSKQINQRIDLISQ
jgi:hypothetical protein